MKLYNVHYAVVDLNRRWISRTAEPGPRYNATYNRFIAPIVRNCVNPSVWNVEEYPKDKRVSFFFFLQQKAESRDPEGDCK